MFGKKKERYITLQKLKKKAKIIMKIRKLEQELKALDEEE